MKITVDRSLCESQAVCIGIVPAVFDLDDEGKAFVVPEDPDPALLDAVEDAAAACPLAAIAVSR